MTKNAKGYMNTVLNVLKIKYNMSDVESYKAFKKSFLYNSLIKYERETLHDDIETNADYIYEDYLKNQTYNDLSVGYKFDEISMNKMAERAKNASKKWELERMSEDEIYIYTIKSNLKKFIKLIKEILIR